MEFLTIKEVQNSLKIGRNAAYKLLQRNDFPCVKFGNSYRIPKDEFEKWCSKQFYNKIFIK